ncbi:MAG: hypothetical protein JSR09_09550 [Bacteroidetes bacterium]|nr:hypothetical protein [Bacteroidota bacterium]
MRTFLLDIIPKIQRFSQKLDNLTVLTNKHWVVIDEELNRKVVFIFREKDSQLLISENGKIEKGTWEYLGNNSLLIDRNDGSYLFKHGFIDDTVLALKVDGKEEYALLVNEHKFDNKINSLTTILQFLNDTYSSERQQRTLTIPESKEVLNTAPKNQIQIKPTKSFISTDYPDLDKDIEKIKDAANLSSDKFITEILISFCRDHSIKAEFIDSNPDFTKKVVNKELPIGLIEQLFRLNSDNNNFISDLETFIKTKLNESYR